MKKALEAGMALRNNQMNYAGMYYVIQSSSRLKISHFAACLPTLLGKKVRSCHWGSTLRYKS